VFVKKCLKTAGRRGDFLTHTVHLCVQIIALLQYTYFVLGGVPGPYCNWTGSCIVHQMS